MGTEITDTYEEIVAAKFCLAEGQLNCAVTHARNAFISAEAAFFDPSLLALLYFPDEQKCVVVELYSRTIYLFSYFSDTPFTSLSSYQ